MHAARLTSGDVIEQIRRIGLTNLLPNVVGRPREREMGAKRKDSQQKY